VETGVPGEKPLQAKLRADYFSLSLFQLPTDNSLLNYYCVEGTEMRQLGFKVRRLLFLNRY
jgi:hypothetical protein